MSRMLEGKAALVTGAAGGIGLEIVRHFHACGARVLAADVNSTGLAGIEADLPGVRGFQVDITKAGDVDALLSAMLDAFGRVDVLVNNAGIGGPRTLRLHEIALDDFDAVMAVNLRAAVALTQKVLPGMMAQGSGAIVNLASPAGFNAVPRLPAYSISKAGMVMLTKQTAKEYAADGIRCNAVAPGVTQTPILDDLPQEHLDQIAGMIPQGRMARPTEIARMIGYLASDEARYVNGTVVFVDGAAQA